MTESQNSPTKSGDEPRPPEDLLAVDYVTVDELRNLHPRTKPLPGDHELDDAECHNCGEPWDDERWNERHLHGGPSAGETWKYRCPNCGFETFEVGT